MNQDKSNLYECKCGASYNTNSSLFNHIRLKHNKDLSMKSKIRQSGRPKGQQINDDQKKLQPKYICKCGTLLSSRGSQFNHWKIIHNKNPNFKPSQSCLNKDNLLQENKHILKIKINHQKEEIKQELNENIFANEINEKSHTTEKLEAESCKDSDLKFKLSISSNQIQSLSLQQQSSPLKLKQEIQASCYQFDNNSNKYQDKEIDTETIQSSCCDITMPIIAEENPMYFQSQSQYLPQQNISSQNYFASNLLMGQPIFVPIYFTYSFPMSSMHNFPNQCQMMY